MSRREGNGIGITLTGFLLRLILIIIFVLLLIWLFPMPNLKHYYSSAFGENIEKMKDAATSYYTNERLPKTEKDSVEISLKEMLDKKLLLPFVDSKGRKCDENHSYVEVTKSGKEYLMKIFLSCDDESDYIVVPMGCYNKCENGSCTQKEKVCTTKYQFKKTVSGTKKVAYCSKSGYVLSGKTCYKKSDIDKLVDAKYKYVCASDYKLSGTNCIKTTTDKKTATCPTGYTGNGTNCTNTTTDTKTATCPTGYTGNGTNCKRTTTDTQTATCPTGYDGNGTNCVKISTQDSTVYDASKTLVRTYTTKTCDTCSTVRHYVYRITSTKDYVCPTGYTRNGTTCTKSSTSTKDYVCPTGYTRNGTTCTKSGTDTKDYVCPTGYTRNGTTCTKSTTETKAATKSYYCEKGKLVGTKCSIKGENVESMSASYKTKSYKTTKYTWSTKTSLNGWTKTGKTKTTCK